MCVQVDWVALDCTSAAYIMSYAQPAAAWNERKVKKTTLQFYAYSISVFTVIYLPSEKAEWHVNIELVGAEGMC